MCATVWMIQTLRGKELSPESPSCAAKLLRLYGGATWSLVRLTFESDQVDAFHENDARMIQSLADLISLGLENAQAYQEIQKDISELKQAEALQQAIYRIAAAAETTSSLDELFPKIHQSIASVMPAENFYIALYDEAKNLLRFPYFRDLVDGPFYTDIAPGQGLTGYVLRTGKSQLCTLGRQAELERREGVHIKGTPAAIWLGIPLIIEGKTIGVMAVQHYSDPEAYGEREQHMLEFVSSQVATAIDRKQAEDALWESEKRYRGLFENSPDSLYEQDFSGIKRRIEALRQSGVSDFRAFFASHPEEVRACMHEIKVVDVNATSLALYRAAHKDQLIGTLEKVVDIDDVQNFVGELAEIAEGKQNSPGRA